MCYEKFNKKRIGEFFSNKRFLKTANLPFFSDSIQTPLKSPLEKDQQWRDQLEIL